MLVSFVNILATIFIFQFILALLSSTWFTVHVICPTEIENKLGVPVTNTINYSSLIY